MRILVCVGNVITANKVPDAVPLKMNNGLTAVVFDVLAMPLSETAKTPWQCRLAYWWVRNDQSRRGLGVVGFDLALLGWNRETFEEEQRYLLGAIAAACARHGWDRLAFTPGPSVLEALLHLGRLVEALDATMIEPIDGAVWAPHELPEHGFCEKHRVFLHELGCIVCNDGG